jgi:hypothetical protein
MALFDSTVRSRHNSAQDRPVRQAGRQAGKQADAAAAALCFTTRLRRRSHRFPRKSSAFQVLSWRVYVLSSSPVQDWILPSLSPLPASTKVRLLLVACESTALHAAPHCKDHIIRCYPLLAATAETDFQLSEEEIYLDTIIRTTPIGDIALFVHCMQTRG